MTFFHSDEQLETQGTGIIDATRAQFPGLAANQVAMTWLVYDLPISVNTGGALTPGEFGKYPVRGFNYRGIEQIYPASIVKLFYLLAIFEWKEKGMLRTTPELERATRDMMIDSSNDATSLVVDVLTGTTSGPELPTGPFETWKSQRNLVNRYLQTLNWPEFESINVNQKTWGDGAYGRERIFLGELMENRNMLTTNATARLLHSIIGGVAVSSIASGQMMTLIQRSLDPKDLAKNPENQVAGFLGGGLPKTAKLWSKAGHTSQVRHDAAYIELNSTQSYLLVVFTEGKAQSKNEEILPFISQKVVEAMKIL